MSYKLNSSSIQLIKKTSIKSKKPSTRLTTKSTSRLTTKSLKKSSTKKSSTKSFKRDLSLPFGLFDVEGLNVNPFTNKPYENLYSSLKMDIDGLQEPMTYQNLAKKWSNLAVYQHKDELLKSIKENQVTLAKAGTGVGKTVLIPKIALHAFDYQGKVLTTIPKRLITRSNAEYAAKCLDTKVGEYVGYYFKGDNKTSDKSKLIFTTTGSVFSKITGSDPYLEEYNCIVIDEAHERSVETDILLLLIKNALKKRKDLRLVIMSATINLEAFRNYYNEFSFGEIDIPGLNFPVTQYWLSKRPTNWFLTAVEIIMKILTTTKDGDILVFGKSSSDGIQVCSMLDGEIAKYNKANPTTLLIPMCIKLAGNSTQEEEDLAKDGTSYLQIKSNLYKENYNRKVVVSTNVAESSLTIDGIVYVIDSGFEFREGYNPVSMVRSLLEEYAPQSSVIQRKGRAGRTREGFCYHLYSQEDYDNLDKYPIPNIQKTDLTPYLLDLMKLEYINNIGDLKKTLNEFISPPDSSFINSSLKLLEALNSISSIDNTGKLTNLGYAIYKFRGIKLGLATSIIYSYYLKCSFKIIDLVSLLIVADGQLNKILLQFNVNKKIPQNKQQQLKNNYNRITSQFKEEGEHSGDFFTLLNIFGKFKNKMNELKLEDLVSKKVELDLGLGDDDNLSDLVENLGENINLRIDDDKDFIGKTEKEIQSAGGKETHKKLIDWCKNNFVHCKNLEKAQLLSKEISRILKDIMSSNQENPKFKIQLPLININELNDLTLENDITEENDKILLSMIIGNLNNISIKTNSKGVYETCFPNKKSLSRFSQDTTLYKPSNIIIYDELFMFSKNSPTVKANIVNNMKSNILDTISNKFDKYLGSCLKSNKKIGKSSKKLFKFSKTKSKNPFKNPFKKQSRKVNKNKKKKFSYFKLF